MLVWTLNQGWHHIRISSPDLEHRAHNPGVPRSTLGIEMDFSFVVALEQGLIRINQPVQAGNAVEQRTLRSNYHTRRCNYCVLDYNIKHGEKRQ